ncbi:5'/3'-nucleotidase SurE [Kovacikia minuta CCNUW1]|uniref:5'/3'-nucleotidase SurE n=1 Tax=Kovacikia minuta TaxID=2931930 RepID=UPI001CC9BFAC|nr:5'/3'-nucleotidase SurE [Kovacikia minuta]UBF26234.1 5'/3'-nucleotidase SurE [Kovacikia minuta CCNUW1]
MSLLLTNDDGIDAPGIRALLRAIGEVAPSPIIAAPRDHQSGCGHQVTTTTPIHVQKRSEMEYAIGGTPVDCVRIALSHLCPEIDWVLSGINAGGNLGADVYISGTVAAVREAALYRIPAIAVSQYRQAPRKIDWDFAAYLTSNVLLKLFSLPLEPGTFWNVNLPHLETNAPMPEIVFCHPCTQPLPATYQIEGDYFYYKGEYSKRLRDPGSDVEVCFSGRIAVTQIRV